MAWEPLNLDFHPIAPSSLLNHWYVPTTPALEWHPPVSATSYPVHTTASVDTAPNRYCGVLDRYNTPDWLTLLIELMGMVATLFAQWISPFKGNNKTQNRSNPALWGHHISPITTNPFNPYSLYDYYSAYGLNSIYNYYADDTEPSSEGVDLATEETNSAAEEADLSAENTVEAISE